MPNVSPTRPRRSAAVTPSVSDVREGLRNTLAPEDFARIWSEVCAAIGVPTEVSTLTDPQLDQLLTRIAAQDRLCHVLALSWRIRSTAARKLAELGR